MTFGSWWLGPKLELHERCLRKEIRSKAFRTLGGAKSEIIETLKAQQLEDLLSWS
jgi:hypothetical protein